ncbi:YIP1 family protein [Rhodobacteraceae bacterium NNCM2]|nr:YIP1 family protein [Coraliihabitans acroporae]
MYSAVFQNVMQGLLQPRASARRMLSLDIGLREVGLLIVLAYAISGIFSFLILPAPPGGRGLINYIGELIGSGLGVLIFAFIIWWPATLFGGKGTWEESLRLSAWLSVLTSVLSPLMLLAITMMPSQLSVGDIINQQTPEGATAATSSAGPMTILFLFYGFWSMWLTASFIAEVHKFRNTWTVFVAMIFVNIGFSLIVARLIS